MADPADDSSCAAGSCLDAEDHTAAQNIDDTEQQLRTELLDLREQHQLQQQEVVLLHAQVERLSMLQLERTSEEGHAAATSSASTSGTTDLLQQQLTAAHAELQHTRSVLDSVIQDHSAAVKTACDQRSGALRLLLAEQTRELQQMEQQRVAALELAATKEEDCEAMRIALAAANAHILQLTAQHAPQHKPSAQTHAHDQHSPAHEAASSAHAQAHAHAHIGAGSSSGQEAPQHSLLQELQLQLSVQRQQLKVANEQVKDLVQHLALKHEKVDFAERRAALLEQQLEDAQQKVAAAAAVSEAQRRHSCASIAEEDSGEHPGFSLEGAATPSRQAQSPQPAMLQQQESPQQQQPEQHSKGLAGSFTAALSNAASGFSFSAGQRDDDHEQPPRQQTPPPLSPFALARKFVADREADAMARLKDELREREQEVAGLVAANSRLQTQLEGLQTILVTRVSQANRLTQELKDVSKQLKQAEAAAVSDHAVLQQQLEQLSEKVLGLQDALAAGKQREQLLETQLAATRGKLAQVLEALVEDAAALQQHKPAQYKLLVQEMPAAMADVMATAAVTAATPAHATAVSGRSNSVEHPTSIPAVRAASMPNDALGAVWNQQHHTGAQHSAATTAAAHGHQVGLQHTSSSRQGPADAAADKLRSFIRSRTLSSTDGAASYSGRGAVAANGIPGDSWGTKSCVAVSSVEMSTQKHALSFTLPHGAGALAACAGTSGAATPKSAAAKLFDVFRKKGREQEEGEAVASRVLPIAQSNRTTGSGEYSYVLLES